jgi:hypothetical protein
MHAHRATDILRPWKLTVNIGNPIGRHKVGALSHLFEQHAHSEHRPNCIAIGP